MDDSATALFEQLGSILRGDDASALRALLQNGLAVNAVNEEGMSPLCEAACFGAADCMQVLLEAGADVAQCNKDGKTALHEAAYASLLRRKNCRPDVCLLLLLRAGAEPSVRDKRGKTPLDYALSMRHMLETGVLRMAVSAGKSPIMQAVWEADTGRLTELLARQPGRVMRLLGRKSAVNDADEFGYTPLHAAVMHGCTACLPLLLAAGSCPDALSRDSSTPLLLATLANDADSVRRLLDAGASPDLADDWGNSPLMHAACLGLADCVRALLDGGAAVEAVNHRRETALFRSVGRPEIMQMLLDAGASVNCTDVHGYSPLLECAKYGGSAEKIVCARMLLAAGAEVNLPDHSGATPLCWAQCTGVSTDMTRVLLEAGADVNRQAGDGHTALHNAALECHSQAVQLLLDAGADPTIRDKDGCLPRECARGMNARECRELLAIAMRERGVPIIDKPVMKVSDIRRRLRRKAVVFRSSVSPHTGEEFLSWLGRVTRQLPGEVWPTDAGGSPLVPLATLFVKDLPAVPSALKKLALITIFAPQDTWGEEAADSPTLGCVIRGYSGTGNLVPCMYEAAEMTPCLLTPELVKNDMPKFPGCGGSGEVWDHIDEIERIQGLDYQQDILEADYEVHKIGGYPTYTQGAPDIPEGYSFVLQICPDNNAGLCLGDVGNYYFYYDPRENDWLVHADCY